MANALDYIAAAVIDIMRRRPTPEISSLAALRNAFAEEYNVALDGDHADTVARRLEQLGFLQRVSDEYAGTYFVPANSINVLLKSGRISTQEPDSQLAKALEGGTRLLSRVFSNEQFWNDFDSQLSSESSEQPEIAPLPGSGIPASDRIVTLTHNQQLDLESSTEQLVEEFSKENSVDGDSTLRQTIFGQLKAGLELIRAQSFRAYLLYETLFSVLGTLVERYRGQAIGEVAKKLLDLLVEHVFGK